MSTQHTPGPWDNVSIRLVVRHTKTSEFIADVGGGTYDERHANADLIATAPDMLDMLETVIEMHTPIPDKESSYLPNLTIQNIRRVIAKAKKEA